MLGCTFTNIILYVLRQRVHLMTTILVARLIPILIEERLEGIHVLVKYMYRPRKSNMLLFGNGEIICTGRCNRSRRTSNCEATVHCAANPVSLALLQKRGRSEATHNSQFIATVVRTRTEQLTSGNIESER